MVEITGYGVGYFPTVGYEILDAFAILWKGGKYKGFNFGMMFFVMNLAKGSLCIHYLNNK
ncbi:MAG: hypothetical protein JO080_00575 [Mucilaginibacter sp.]|nr:hypothetical protein [Mucilaginibacter sp.]